VTPLSSEPAVIVIEPTDHGTDVEGAIDGVQLVGGTGDAGSVRDDGALNNGAEKLGALLELKSLETTAQGVQEDETGGVKLGGVSILVLVFFFLWQRGRIGPCGTSYLQPGQNPLCIGECSWPYP
jgi:hypothetical protein